MTIEVAVRKYLASRTEVTSLVGQRIFQLILPQDVELPAVRIQTISEPQPYHLRGPADLKRTRIQIDCYGKTTGFKTGDLDPYTVVSNVAAAVNAVLSGVKFKLQDVNVQGIFRVTRRALYEGEELRLVRVSQDFEVWAETTD